MYVCDSTNNQVSKWAPSAKTCTIAAGGNGWGPALNQLKNPIAVFIDSKDTLYVSDYNASRVLKFPPGSTSSTNGVVVAGGHNSGTALDHLNDPTGIYVDSSGNIYVADAGNNRVVKWSPGAKTGAIIIQGSSFWFPSGLCGAGSDSLIVTQGKVYYLGLPFGSDGIYKFPLNGTASSNYNNGKSSGSGSTPAFPFLDKLGNLYVVEHGSNDVLEYKNGTFVKVAGGTTGNLANQLNNPSGLWVVNETMYVGDYKNYRVQKWAPSIDTTFTPATPGKYYAVITRFSGAQDTTNTILVSDSSSSITNISICPSGSYTFNGSSYTKTGTYKATLTNSGGCDSIATLNLTVKDTTSSVTRVSICKNGSYTFNGITCTIDGTYAATLTNSEGCDSIATLILTVKDTATSTTNATICAGKSYVFCGSAYSKAGTYSANFNLTGTCDSVAYLVLSVKDTTSSVTKASICKGVSYLFNGISYSDAGTYSSTLTNAVGCDSTAYLILTIKDTTSSVTKASICIGDSYLFNGNTYASAGTYANHFTNAAGCDSIAYLQLTLKDTTSSITKASICPINGTYIFNGSSYTKEGTYITHLTNSAGCDSAATLILTYKDTTSSITKASICPINGTYMFNGTNYKKTGTYTVHLTNSAGCDSAATLILTYKDTTSSLTNASICPINGSYTFNGTNCTKSGIYTAHLTNSEGCDSAATLILVYKDTTSSITKASICIGSSYTFNGSTYNKAGTYSANLSNSSGCDSAAVLVLSEKDTTSSLTNISICNGDSYTFNGSVYSKKGTYSVHISNRNGCDSVAFLVLTLKDTTSSIARVSICKGDSYTFNGSVYNSAGTYSSHLINSVGCDSIAKLILAVKDTTSSLTTAHICLGNSYLFNGTNYNTAGTYTVHLTNGKGCDSAAILVLVVDDPTNYPIEGHLEVCNGDTIHLSNHTKGGKWSSKSPTIATIDSVAGILTGIKTGTAKVQYEINASCGQQTITQDFLVSGVKPTREVAIPKLATCINPLSGGFTVAITGTESPYTFSYNGEKYNSTTYVTNLGVGIYSVDIYNEYNCLVDSLYNIPITLSPDASCDTFYVPSGFVPNSSLASGHNNLLKPYGGSSSILSMVFRVYNRGGYLIFESHDLYSGWDGTINGVLQNVGTYIWALEYTLKDGKRRFASGTSVLFR